MPYSLDFSKKGDCLHVIVNGTIIAFEELFAEAKAIMREIVDSDFCSILIDERRAEFFYDTHDIFRLADLLEAEMVQTKGLKVAAVHNPSYAYLGRICETCYRNRSINYKAFDCEKKALDWLAVEMCVS